jgi:hypothetical protein
MKKIIHPTGAIEYVPENTNESGKKEARKVLKQLRQELATIEKPADIKNDDIKRLLFVLLKHCDII